MGHLDTSHIILLYDIQGIIWEHRQSFQLKNAGVNFASCSICWRLIVRVWNKWLRLRRDGLWVNQLLKPSKCFKRQVGLARPALCGICGHPQLPGLRYPHESPESLVFSMVEGLVPLEVKLKGSGGLWANQLFKSSWCLVGNCRQSGSCYHPDFRQDICWKSVISIVSYYATSEGNTTVPLELRLKAWRLPWHIS